MSNYTKTTDFDVKDSLPSGDTGKIIRGSEFEVEFENIEVAIASKADSLNTVLTGTTTATNLSVTGNTTLGNAASDTVTVNADFSSDLLPSADATYDLGAPGSEWQDLYVTGTANVDSLVADTVTISGGTITATLTGNVTGNLTGDVTGDLTGTVLTAAQPNITSVGTLTSASISGDLAVDTDTLFVDVSTDRIGVNTSSPATALDVNGTVTADALSVLNGTTTTGIIGTGGNQNDSVLSLQFRDRYGTAGFTDGQIGAYIQSERDGVNARYDLVLGTTSSISVDAVQRLRIADDGDISFYEDTGTTPKFFWDASAESLGIGTTSPASALDVNGTVTADGLTVDGTAVVEGIVRSEGTAATLQLKETDVTDQNTALINSTGDLSIRTANDAFTSFTTRFSLDHATGDISFYEDTGTTAKFFWDASAESLGIGTSNPLVKLQVENNGSNEADVARFLRSNGTNISFLDISLNPNAEEVILDCSGSTAQTLVFRSGGTEHMRLDSSGNLLVGAIVSPATMLTDGYSGFAVDGTNDYIVSSRFNNIAAFFKRENSDGAVVAFYKDGTSVGTISVTASTTSYNTSSDVRLKENITDAPQGTVDALQVRSFDWKADGSHQEYGFIAQELEPVAPYAVTKGETEDDMWSVDYSKLVPMLVKEIQDLKARVATLEAI